MSHSVHRPARGRIRPSTGHPSRPPRTRELGDGERLQPPCPQKERSAGSPRPGACRSLRLRAAGSKRGGRVPECPSAPTADETGLTRPPFDTPPARSVQLERANPDLPEPVVAARRLLPDLRP